MQGVTVRAVVTEAPVTFNGDSANRQGGDEMVDQHTGEHAHHEGHNLIRTPQQDVDRIVDGFGDGYGFHNDLRRGMISILNKEKAFMATKNWGFGDFFSIVCR